MSVVTAGPRSFTCHTTSESLGPWGVRCASIERKPPILVASGSSEEWSPIGLLVGAIESSVLLTMQRHLEMRGMAIEACYSETDAVIELDDGSYRLERVVMRPTLIIADASLKNAVLEVLEEARHDSMVANSLSAPVVVKPTVTVAGH